MPLRHSVSGASQSHNSGVTYVDSPAITELHSPPMDPTLIAAGGAAAVMCVLVLGAALFAFAGWMSFESRIDRRRKRRERFRASWGAMLHDAELAAQNARPHRTPIDRP